MCQWNGAQHRRRRGNATSHHGQQTVESLKEEESQVSLIISKRLRNARKRLGKIREIQRKEARGEELNEDQRVALGHAVGQELLVEELEKMVVLVADAVKEEREENVLYQEKWMQQARSQHRKSMERAVESAKKESEAMVEEARRDGMVQGVERIIELLYLAGIFDPFIPYQMEKNAVLQCMDGETGVDGHSLGEMLDMIGVLGKMMTSRPLGEVKSHEESLKQCQDVALTYAMGSTESVLGWNGCMTKEQVKNMVDKIRGLEYFTVQGEAFPMTHPIEQQDAMYYGVPLEQPVVAPPPPPPPPPPPAPGYVSPRDAAVSGENVLSQFFNQNCMPNKSSEGMDESSSLGLQEVSTIEESHVLVSKNTMDVPLEIQEEKKAAKKKKWKKGKKMPVNTALGDQEVGQKMIRHTSKRQGNRVEKTNMKTR